MLHLSYISTATKTMSEDDLVEILRVSRENNANRGITGMLLFSNGTFVQVLEGEEKNVNALVEIIKRDPRHRAFHVLEKRTIGKREFPDWSMGFKRVTQDELEEIPGVNRFFEEGYDPGELEKKTNLINQLLGHIRREEQKLISHEELSLEDEDKFIVALHWLIRSSVKVLAVMMVFTILWSVVDVGVVIYEKLLHKSITALAKEDILYVFGSFMIVLIAIEIFINITLYIRSHVIPVKLVVATALMAVARKIIVLDFNQVSALHVMATGLLVIALGGTYWLLEREFNPHSD